MEILATFLLVDHYKPPEPTAEQASPQASPNCDDHFTGRLRADANSPGLPVNRCKPSRLELNLTLQTQSIQEWRQQINTYICLPIFCPVKRSGI